MRHAIILVMVVMGTICSLFMTKIKYPICNCGQSGPVGTIPAHPSHFRTFNYGPIRYIPP